LVSYLDRANISRFLSEFIRILEVLQEGACLPGTQQAHKGDIGVDR